VELHLSEEVSKLNNEYNLYLKSEITFFSLKSNKCKQFKPHTYQIITFPQNENAHAEGPNFTIILMLDASVES